MPYVKGGCLDHEYQKIKRFPEPVVKFYAVQIILAINEIHQKGYVHRDLKLQNILIDTDGYLKLIDFGFAKMLE